MVGRLHRNKCGCACLYAVFAEILGMQNVNGKVIVITGASSGIGRAAAMLLAEHGAKLVLGARGEEALKSTVNEIESAGGSACYHVTDVSKQKDMAALVGLACDQHGKLDVLISNAGVGPISRLDAIRVQDWELMVDVIFKGALYGIAEALPVFLSQSSGHFVTIVSTAGIQISPTMAVYAAAKNAVRTLNEGLRLESGGRYRVTSISPGFVRTDFAGSMSDLTVRATIQKQMDEIALDPMSVARAIVFAISQADDVDVNDIVVRPAVQG